MKRVRLDYGRDGLCVDLPSDSKVIEPRREPALPDEAAALRAALRQPIGSPPLRELVHPGDRIVVVHTDITRPMPNERVLPVLLAELEAAGAAPDDITLLNALGTHRPQTPAELDELLGPDIVRRYRCLQHDAWDAEQLVPVGDLRQAGTRAASPRPILLNRAYVDAQLRILTGFIEPHFFAGFSGGPKAVLPGIAGIDSVLANHGPDKIAHPRATWGVTYGNPVWDEMLDVAVAAGNRFVLNVTLNRERHITGVFAGALEAAHSAGCEACRRASMVSVASSFHIVVTTNAGHPLDLNLYQSVKGMSAARQIVKRGGAIVIATACAEGLPEHGEYANLLRHSDSPRALLSRLTEPGFTCHDQWQAQTQAEIQLHADVHVFSEGLTEQQIRSALFTPCHDVSETVSELVERFGPGAAVCVLPSGPFTVPYVAPSA
jgi:nickel-dependent lactate racemase